MNAENTVQAQVEAYNARDLTAFEGFYDEKIEIFHSPGGPLFLSGKEQLRAVYSKLFAENPNLHCRVEKRIVVGNFVIDQEHVSEIRGGNLVCAAIYFITDGKILRVWFAK